MTQPFLFTDRTIDGLKKGRCNIPYNPKYEFQSFEVKDVSVEYLGTLPVPDLFILMRNSGLLHCDHFIKKWETWKTDRSKGFKDHRAHVINRLSQHLKKFLNRDPNLEFVMSDTRFNPSSYGETHRLSFTSKYLKPNGKKGMLNNDHIRKSCYLEGKLDDLEVFTDLIGIPQALYQWRDDKKHGYSVIYMDGVVIEYSFYQFGRLMYRVFLNKGKRKSIEYNSEDNASKGNPVRIVDYKTFVELWTDQITACTNLLGVIAGIVVDYQY